MKLRYGVDLEQELRTNLERIADTILDKVSASKKMLDDEAVTLIAGARTEFDTNKKQGKNIETTYIFCWFYTV